jgi:cobalt/nickel transport system ATP-binding protein
VTDAAGRSGTPHRTLAGRDGPVSPPAGRGVLDGHATAGAPPAVPAGGGAAADDAAGGPAGQAGHPGVGDVPQPLVAVRGLRHTYSDGTSLDFGETPLVVRPGERVVLLGPNGSGKSTLLLHTLGLIEAQAGEVRVFGHPAHRLPPRERVRLAALLQQVDEQIVGPTVWDDVAFTPRNLGLREADVAQLVDAALRRMGIWHLRQKVPHALSAGERRKVALAGAIVFASERAIGPRLLVLDEPFTALDPPSRRTLEALIEELRQEHGTGVLLTTHLMQTVPEIADVVYVLAPGGRIAAWGTPEEVFSRPEVLEALGVDPPVLWRLFRFLEQRGICLPPPRSIEHAADVLASRCRAGGRLLPVPGRARSGE